jgi:Fe-S cluster assembly ATP-binding protein
LTLEPGKLHAIMGPNGAGKSTLGHVLAGREGYEVTAGIGRVQRPESVDAWSLKNARRPVCFWPSSIRSRFPGVNNTYFLRTALNAQRKARGEEELDAMAVPQARAAEAAGAAA